MGKKPIVSVTYENERISIKNSLLYLKCVLVLCYVSPVWSKGLFTAVLQGHPTGNFEKKT